LCRLLAIIGKPNNTIKNVFKYFIEVSKRDELLLSLNPRSSGRHGDGWGIVAIGAYGNKYSYIMYRCNKAIYEDNNVDNIVDQINSFDYIVSIIHSRAASAKNTVHYTNSHPFPASTNNFEAWLIHNGFVDIEKLSKTLYGYYDPAFKENISDTVFALQYIVRNAGRQKKTGLNESIMFSLRDICREYTKTAFMSMLLVNEYNSYTANLYITSCCKNSNKMEYYRLYTTSHRNLIFFYSSSLAKYLEYSTPIDNNVIIRYEIDLKTRSIVLRDYIANI